MDERGRFKFVKEVGTGLGSDRVAKP